MNMALGSPVLAPRTQARTSRRAPSKGSKRSAAAAELSEDEAADMPEAAQDEADTEAAAEPATAAEAALMAAPAAAAPARRSQRKGAGDRLAQLLVEEAGGSDVQPAPTRVLPARATATSSPAGNRRGKIARLLQLAEAAAAEEAATAEPSDAAQATELAPHLQATRAAVMAAQDTRAQRVQAVRRRHGEPKDFVVGDAVLLLPPKRGRCGRPVGPKRIVCRVVGLQRFHGMTKFRLRCNAGVLNGYHCGAELKRAPSSAAEKLQFAGTEVEGVPKVTLDKAWAAEDGATASVKCRCRGKCGKGCACKKANVPCSRNCGCIAGKGGNCCNH